MSIAPVFGHMFGQAALARELAAAVQGDAVTHAWLFLGPAGSGRSTAATALAAAVLCPHGGCDTCDVCHSVTGGTHPDVWHINPEGLSVGVGEVRALIRQASHTPSIGQYQVVILEDADRLSEAASNALLKALEEPSRHTLFLLCAPSMHPQDVPVTIRSRCRIAHLRTPTSGEIAEALQERDGLDADRAAWAASVAHGHVGRARALAHNEAARTRREKILTFPHRLTNIGACIAAAEEFVHTIEEETTATAQQRNTAEQEELARAHGAGGRGRGVQAAQRSATAARKELEGRQKKRTTRTQRDSLDLALLELLGVYRDVLMVCCKAASYVPLTHPDQRREIVTLAESATPQQATRWVAAVLEAREMIAQNVKPRIAVEAMMVQLQVSRLAA